MLPPQIESYIARSVLPAMGIAGRSFALRAPRQAGTRSSLHVVDAEGIPLLLLRVFDHRGQAARNAAALRHLEARGLPAPRLVFHEGWRSNITVETWIEGTPHADLADAKTASAAALGVATLLARFHAVTRASWGRPEAALRPRLVSFAAAALRSARRMLWRLAGGGWFAGSQAAALQARFGSWKEAISTLDTFSLVHNDANRHNFLVGSEGQVTPVDLHRLAYEPFPEEVVNALYHFCRKDADLGELFLRRYFLTAGEASQRTFDRTRGFFEPLNYLKKMHQRSASAVARDDAKMLRWRDLVLALEPPS